MNHDSNLAKLRFLDADKTTNIDQGKLVLAFGLIGGIAAGVTVFVLSPPDAMLSAGAGTTGGAIIGCLVHTVMGMIRPKRNCTQTARCSDRSLYDRFIWKLRAIDGFLIMLFTIGVVAWFVFESRVALGQRSGNGALLLFGVFLPFYCLRVVGRSNLQSFLCPYCELQFCDGVYRALPHRCCHCACMLSEDASANLNDS